MRYLWLKAFTEENMAAIEQLKAVCFARDGRLPLLNLPEQPEECDACLAAVTEQAEIVGILTCLYGENTVEVCELVHPEFRGQGIGTGLMHRLILSTIKVPVFPVAADDEGAMAYLTYLGKREICREMLMTLTRENYTDAAPGISPGRKKRLRVTCVTRTRKEKNRGTASDGQMRYVLYCGAVSIGHCLVTDGCVSGVWIRGAFRSRGYGSFLLRTVIRHQFCTGRKKLILHVTNLNHSACAVYQKYGFEITEEVVDFL